MPVIQHLSIDPTSDDSQWALNSMRAKCSPGKRSGTPPPISWQMTCCGTIGWYTAWVNAGQPNLALMNNKEFSPEDLIEFESLNNAWKQAAIKGREHE